MKYKEIHISIRSGGPFKTPNITFFRRENPEQITASQHTPISNPTTASLRRLGKILDNAPSSIGFSPSGTIWLDYWITR
jgi:hypothetical protein